MIANLKKNLAVSMLSALTVAGCTLEPHYERPEAPIARRLANPPARDPNGPTTEPVVAADLGWKDFFGDPMLQTLIAKGLVNNRDLRVTVLNVEAARAKYQIERSNLFPTINASATRPAARTPAGFGFPGEPSVIRYDAASIGVTSYEVDLFGKTRSLDKAALEQYFSLGETRRSAQLSLVASIADGYLTVLADRELVKVTEDTVRSEQASFDLTQRALDSGTGTELALRQAETALLAAKTNRSLYARQVLIDTDLLVVLVGDSLPDSFAESGNLDSQGLSATVPADLSSSVLVQRPDVVAAEHNLIAANANIGAARAAFFPSITLTGSLGSESYQLHGLFKSGSKAWSFTPEINLPIFTGGANQANLDLSKVDKRIEVATYEKTLQTAFREVSDALAGLDTLDDQLSSQQQLVRASAQNYKLADLRYTNGIDNYLTSLDAQRSLYSAQQQLVNVKLQRLENLVALYQALGGGWLERSGQARDPLELPSDS